MNELKVIEVYGTDWAGKPVRCYRVIEHCGSYKGEDLWLPHIELFSTRENAESYLKSVEIPFP